MIGRLCVASLLLLPTFATTIARADVRVGVSIEGQSDCPTRGELLDALGPEFGMQGERQITVVLGAANITVSEPPREPMEREIPDADCATRARLIAIIVRGYAREGDHEPAPPAPAPPPGPNAIAIFATALGPALEIDPLGGALALHLEGGLGYSLLRLRIALDATSATSIGNSADAISRMALVGRIDVGLMAALGAGFELGALIGAGASLALVSEALHSQQLLRASPVVSLSVLGEARLAGPVWLRLELGADLACLRDGYIVADTVPDFIALAPIASLRALAGIVLRGD